MELTVESLTDLEAVAIGHVSRNQPCTAHFIRSCFRNSQLTKFSDSAGSVYPMMKRLEKGNYIVSETRQVGHRRVRYFSVTKVGRDAFRKWIGPPISISAALSVDPLRTRIIYLRLIPFGKRRQWLDSAEQLVREKLNEVFANMSDQRADEQGGGADIFYQLANENAVIELKARLKWILGARKKLLAAKMIPPMKK